jgi:hypothetical protein
MYLNICYIPIPGESSHESSEVLNISRGWEQSNGSSTLGQGGDSNHSRVNQTPTYGAAEYGTLGGHTVLQVPTANHSC